MSISRKRAKIISSKFNKENFNVMTKICKVLLENAVWFRSWILARHAFNKENFQVCTVSKITKSFWQ